MTKFDFTQEAIEQKKLDEYIKSNNGDLSEQMYWEDRIIALQVEVAELINEIRFFKFWSKKPQSEKEVILEEFADCLHFALSLGNSLEIDDFIFAMGDMKRPIRLIYFDINQKLLDLIRDKNVRLLKSIMFNLFEIAWFMGYSEEDVKTAYTQKRIKNYDRQNTNY